MFLLKKYLESQIKLYEHRANLQSDNYVKQYSYGCIEAYRDILKFLNEEKTNDTRTIQKSTRRT